MNALPTNTGAVRVVKIPWEVTRAHAWMVLRSTVTASLAMVISTYINKGLNGLYFLQPFYNQYLAKAKKQTNKQKYQFNS